MVKSRSGATEKRETERKRGGKYLAEKKPHTQEVILTKKWEAEAKVSSTLSLRSGNKDDFI